VALEPSSRHNSYSDPIGDRALVVSDSQPMSATKNFMATTAFTMVKDQVSSFAEKSQTLMKVLDEVGKIHPFIQSMSRRISLEIGPDIHLYSQLLYLCSARPSRWN